MSRECVKCGEPVSDRARKCHSCGASLSGVLAESNAIPPMPTHCTISDCKEKVAVLFVRVKDDKREYIGWFSRFGRKDGKNLFMQAPYTFIQWIGLCPAHYMQKADENGTAHLPPPEQLLAERMVAKQATAYLEAHADYQEK